MRQYLGLDIGGTFIKYALMREDGSFLRRGKAPAPTDSLDQMLGLLESIGAQFAGEYEGVAVSMPGRIDTRAGIAHTGGAFGYISETPVGELFAARLGKPVCAANDGKCAANAEAWSGALAGVENGAVIVLGTGTGGGILLNGKIWMGCSSAAGELSFLPAGFAAMWAQDAHPMSGTWSVHMSATGLILHYAAIKGADPAGLDGLRFFEAYDAGEPEAAAALEEFGQMAASGIYAIQSLLDLERYAIGGGISARPEVTDVIRRKVEELYERIPFTAFGKPEVVRCRYGNDANLIGALRFLLEQA